MRSPAQHASLSLEQIDAALAAWKRRLAAVAGNLLELQAEGTYRALTGSGGARKVQLTGASAARVEPALREVVGMFEHFELLQSTLDRASTLRAAAHGLFGNEGRLREIDAILREASIKLPAVDVPLAQRTLAGGNRRAECVSLEELLTLMSAAFTSARDAVLSVANAWTELAERLDRMEREAMELETHANTGELALVVAGIRTQAQTDPFGALGELSSRAEPLLARQRKTADAALRLGNDLTGARDLWRGLNDAHRLALAARSLVESRVEDCGSLPAPAAEAQLQGLRDWLERLEEKHAEGAVEAVLIGVRQWRAAAAETLRADEAARVAATERLALRDELRGRFEALKAKARAYRLAETEPLLDGAREAQARLYARPAHLGRAADAVDAYDKTIRTEVQRRGSR